MAQPDNRAMPPIVRCANHSGIPYTGWVRTKVDSLPPHQVGHVGDVVYVLGQQDGLDTWAVDLLVTLAPGQTLTVDLSAAEPGGWKMPQLPDPAGMVAHFGGLPRIDGLVMQVLGHEVDGACLVTRLLGRTRRALAVHAWMRWSPLQPELAHAEAITVASDPTTASLSETMADDLRFEFGDALVWVPGAGIGGRLLAAGDTLADGQGRALPMTLLWPRHCKEAQQFASAVAMASMAVSAVGVSRIHPEGAPLMPTGMSGLVWAHRWFGQVIRELHTRGETELGPLADTDNAGGNEVQLYHVGGEALLEDGVGAEVVRYLNAIREHALQPCNHLEADGTPLEIAKHPNLRFWDGRRHWHPNVSPDRLGKTADLSVTVAGGHWGPDVQHHYIGCLTSAARLRWSPLCQWLMERQATVYLLQRTDVVGWSTTAFESPREWGCEADLVLRLWTELRNRALAQKVVDRFRSRMAKVFVPQLSAAELIYPRERDPRVNPEGWGAQWWQEAFAAAAVWRTCGQLLASGGGDGIILNAAQAICARVARKVLSTAWHQGADRSYRAQPQGPIDGSPNAVNPATLSFNSYGMPLAAWLVLQVEPGHAKARAVWDQCVSDPGEKARRWMLPLGVA